jgi:Flp pilus assembly protein TadD
MGAASGTRACALVMTVVSAVGCGSRGFYDVTPASTKTERTRPDVDASPAGALGTVMARFRELQASARPMSRPASTTLETSDPDLAAALMTATLEPSAEHLRAVAEEYRRLKVFDKAHHYLNRALAAAPKDWRVHDSLARVWRDAGLPHVGLGDAYRAVHHAPKSAAARNTLGTLLQALGHRADARRAYEAATQLEPQASYAHNNLCYSWVLEGEGEKAIGACRRAVALAPGSAMAHNNAALAYSLVGDVRAARAAFEATGGPAAARFNTGIVHMASHEWDLAASAFQDALTADPTLRVADVRARQARALIGRGTHE